MKPTKRSMTIKLDKLCSHKVRLRGHCERCGPDIVYNYSYLQCAHIYSRTYRNTRWSLNNLLSLCPKCHFWSHRNPLEFAEWVMVYKGREHIHALREERNKVKKWTIPAMAEEYINLGGKLEI